MLSHILLMTFMRTTLEVLTEWISRANYDANMVDEKNIGALIRPTAITRGLIERRKKEIWGKNQTAKSANGPGCSGQRTERSEQQKKVGRSALRYG